MGSICQKIQLYKSADFTRVYKEYTVLYKHQTTCREKKGRRSLCVIEFEARMHAEVHGLLRIALFAAKQCSGSFPREEQ